MANTNAINVKTSAAPVVKTMPAQTTTTICSATFTTSQLALNDTVTFQSIPAGAYLVRLTIDSDQLDSNVSPTITLDLGISGTTQKFIAASTVAQAGGTTSASALVAGTAGYSPTVDTPLLMTIHAAAATKKAGTIRVIAEYTMDP